MGRQRLRLCLAVLWQPRLPNLGLGDRQELVLAKAESSAFSQSPFVPHQWFTLELPSRLERKTETPLASRHVAEAYSTFAFGAPQLGKIQKASILIVGGRLYSATMTCSIHVISLLRSLVAKSGRRGAPGQQILHWAIARARIIPLFVDAK